MSEARFDKEEFLKATTAFRAKLDLEEALAVQVSRALAVIGNAAVKLVALCRESTSEKGPVITAKISESLVQVAGGGRNVFLAAARGVASDNRLPEPRSQTCGLILVYGHLTGENESGLVATLRVYENGDLSDGEVSWNIEDGVEGFLSYLAHIVSAIIFHSKVYWPAVDNMPAFLQKVPVLEEELHEDSLRKPCVGFECNLARDVSGRK